MRKDLSTSSRLILLVVVLSSLLVAVGTLGLVGVYRSNDALKTVYADRTVPMYQLSEVQRLMQRVWLIIAIGGHRKSPEFIAPYLKDADASLVTLHKLYADYLKTYLTPEEKPLAEQLGRAIERMEKHGFEPALAAMRAGQYDEVLRIEVDVMIADSVSYRNTVQALTELQLSVASDEYQAATKRFDTYRLASIASMGGGLAFALLFGGFLVRNIVRSKVEFEDNLQAKRDLERQLQQSQKVQALGQLTGGIAHDFNNILAAILGYANLALSKQVPDKDSKLAKYLREIITASERARDLVAKMLTFTRTKPSQNVSLMSPAAVVDEARSLMAHSIPSSIQVTASIEDRTRILVDAGELNQVLVNLMINSRDAILAQGPGHGRIDIRVRRSVVANQISLTSQRRISGTFLEVQVSDTGSGIAADHLPRVFDPFFTTKDIGKGTGLGLSMVQGIMMRAGGHILLQSTPGQGTCFQLLFPLPEEADSDAPAPVAENTEQGGQGQVVWIVDDEPALTGYMHDLVSDWGYQTRVFNDSRQALDAFKEEQPDLGALITDLTMPGLTGAELVKQVHALKPGIPVVFCTGFTDTYDRGDITSMAGCRVLVKPVSSADLASTLEVVMKR